MATAKKAGLSTTTLKRPAPRDRGDRSAAGASMVSALRTRAGGDSSGITTVELVDVAANPDNPAARLDDVEALAASIEQVGVLQPLTITSAASFVAANPHHKGSVDGAPWVVLDGHRRREAARVAGLTAVPVMVREDLSHERSGEVILHANLHRRELTALEEARAYQRVIDQQGLSQRQLALHTGVSQAQISKRLALLGLPEPIQEGIDGGQVPVIEALELLKEPAEVQDRVGQMYAAAADTPQVQQLVREAERRIGTEHREAEAQRAAQVEACEYVVDPSARFGPVSYNQELRNDNAVAAARERGDLAVAPGEAYGRPGPRYFRTSTVQRPSATDQELDQRERDRQRRAAGKARLEALTRIVARKPPERVMHEATTRLVLHGSVAGADVARIAIPLTAAAGLTSEHDPGQWYEWRHELADLSGGAGLHAAWIITLAVTEFAARSPYSGWGTEEARYLQWLTDQGYSPSPWELAQLEPAEPADDDGDEGSERDE